MSILVGKAGIGRDLQGGELREALALGAAAVEAVPAYSLPQASPQLTCTTTPAAAAMGKPFSKIYYPKMQTQPNTFSRLSHESADGNEIDGAERNGPSNSRHLEAKDAQNEGVAGVVGESIAGAQQALLRQPHEEAPAAHTRPRQLLPPLLPLLPLRLHLQQSPCTALYSATNLHSHGLRTVYIQSR